MNRNNRQTTAKDLINSIVRGSSVSSVIERASKTKITEGKEYMHYFDDIKTGMAKAFFADAWASAMEEAGESFSGMDIMDVAPFSKMSEYGAIDKAKKCYDSISKANNGIDLVAYFEENYPNDSIEEFGHYLAMQYMGHGVSWRDDHPDFKLKMAHGEGLGFTEDDLREMGSIE